MRRPIALALVLVLPLAVGCDPDKNAASSSSRPDAASRRAAASSRRAAAAGRELVAYAPATDFTGAAPEDGVARAGALFDGSRSRSAGGTGVGAGDWTVPGRSGKRIVYTRAQSERISDLGGAEPPLPDDYDYSRSGATPGTATGAGQTLLEFARFQIEQRFPSVAPIMSRAGWGASARRGGNVAQTPYRVTVHHTQGHRAMSEAEAKSDVKNTQWYHMVGRAREGKEAFSDIGYHFLIAGDGRVVEGRRAEYLGAHAGGANGGNVGVAMMGDFNKIRPTDAQIESLTRLVTFLSIKYKKDPAAKGFLEPHQHYTSTDCPGVHMMEILDALRRKIDRENEQIMAGGRAGEFTPMVVTSA